MSKLPNNLWNSHVIRQRLEAEAHFESCHGLPHKPHYWVSVPQADTKSGGVVLQNYKQGLQNADPHEAQMQFAYELQKILIQEAGFDGLWIVGFTHPPSTYSVITDTENCWGRLIMIWLDEDGDPQFTLESDRLFVEQFQDGPNYWVERAHEAYNAYLPVFGRKAMKADLLLKDGEHMRKAALESLSGKAVTV